MDFVVKRILLGTIEKHSVYVKQNPQFQIEYVLWYRMKFN